MEKPADVKDARRMLAALSGREHRVHTGVALIVPKPQGGVGGGVGGSCSSRRGQAGIFIDGRGQGVLASSLMGEAKGCWHVRH
jgi:hypothetical protein